MVCPERAHPRPMAEGACRALAQPRGRGGRAGRGGRRGGGRQPSWRRGHRNCRGGLGDELGARGRGERGRGQPRGRVSCTDVTVVCGVPTPAAAACCCCCFLVLIIDDKLCCILRVLSVCVRLQPQTNQLSSARAFSALGCSSRSARGLNLLRLSTDKAPEPKGPSRLPPPAAAPSQKQQNARHTQSGRTFPSSQTRRSEASES